MKWEYCYCENMEAGELSLDNVFKTMGAEGWECFVVIPVITPVGAQGFTLFFKRPKVESQGQ